MFEDDMVLDRVKKTKGGSKLKKAPKYDVILFNNDVTSFDTVILILTNAFSLDTAAALAIAKQAHSSGKAYVVRGVTKEIAFTLLSIAQALSRKLDNGRLKFEVSESN